MSTQTVSQVHRWPARAAGTRSHITGLVLCCSVLFLLHAGNQGVMERFSGEAWYALISKNMAESRNYLVPLFFDKPFFDKPILYYWVQILSFRLFGTNEFAIVFPSGLFGLLTVLATYLFTSRFLDAGTGLLSAALLATTVSFFIRARHAETDSLFTFFLTLAFFSLYRAIHAPERRRAAFWLSCLAMGLASLTKGPLGVLFPGLIGGLYLLITRNAAHFRHLPLASGLAILAAVALPWYGIITYLYGWHFVQEFLVRNHLERFFGLERGLLIYPFWFYVPALLFGFLPWSPFLVAALAAGAATGRRLFDPRHRLSLYLGLWVTVMFLTFSLARGKNEYYLLPAYPALAILVARYLRNRAGPASARLPLDFAGGATLSALLLLGTGVTVAFGLQPSPWSVTVAGVLTGGGTAVAWALARKRNHLVPWTIAGTGGVCYLILILLLFPQLDDTRTFKPLALTINHEWRPGDQIVMTTLFPRPMSISQGQTDFIAKLNMSFYLNQPFTFLADPHALRQALASEQRVFCVIGRRIFEAELEGRNIVSHLLASRPVFRATGAYPQLRLRARHEALPDAVLLISNRPSTRTGGNERRRPSVPRAHDRLARYPD